MTEESKIDSDYVHMDAGYRPGGNSVAQVPAGLDDPSLSQEEKDLRLAIALQQQENSQAMAGSKKKIEEAQRSNLFRTGRSGVNTRLANVRQKDHGMLSVPSAYANDNAYVSADADYLPPAGSAAAATGNKQIDSDHQLARELQKVESEDVDGTLAKEKAIDDSMALRTGRSGKGAFHKTRKQKN